MDVIPTIADEFFVASGVGARLFFAPEPGVVGFGTLGFGAAVFGFEFERNRAEKAGSTFANVSGEKEGADVLADAVVEVGVPALGLVFERFPADEDVERGFPFEDGGKLGLEGAGGSEALGGSGFVGFGVIGLLLNPVAQVAVGQLLQGGVVEAVCLVPFGRLADLYGRKKIFGFGIVVFTLSSLLCAVASSAFQLILFRILQGISMGTATVVFALFIGRVEISEANYPALVKSIGILFTLFSILCFGGIFASLVRGKTRLSQ